MKRLSFGLDTMCGPYAKVEAFKDSCDLSYWKPKLQHHTHKYDTLHCRSLSKYFVLRSISLLWKQILRFSDIVLILEIYWHFLSIGYRLATYTNDDKLVKNIGVSPILKMVILLFFSEFKANNLICNDCP